MRSGAALLIGVGSYKYADRVAPLRFAARDAAALAGLLADPHHGAFPPEKVLLRTDGDSSRDELVSRVSRWLPEVARGADVALLYFAGHGLVHHLASLEEGYVLPHDADPDDVVTHGIAMTELARWVNAIEAASVIVCLDCCHAGRVLARHPGPGVAARDLAIRPALLHGIAGGRGRYLIASCDEGQVSIESEKHGHGIFTHHLLRGMRGAADRDQDGKVGVHELFEYVASAVEHDARSLGFTQRPWYQASGPGGAYVTTASSGNHDPDRTMLTVEGLPVAEGPDAVVAVAESALDSGPLDRLLSALEWLRHHASPAGVSCAFRALTHSAPAVRERGREVLRAIGWDRVGSVVLDLARRGETQRLGPILDGMAAFEAHRDVVRLLDQLVVHVKGPTRDRVVLLLERKKLALDLDSIAEVFRDLRSPYRLDRVLGQGLITAAYLARDELSGHDVVVRVLRPELASQPEARTRFLDLSWKSLRFVHQNLVLTREVRSVPEKQLYFVVRDHVPGITLQRLIDSGRAFTPLEVRAIVRQVLHGLRPFHQAGLAHGGVKPSNIFVNTADAIVLGDPSPHTLGLTLELTRLSYDYRYAPPEQFLNDGRLAPASDFYALGCVTYELCSGAPPFTSANPFELASRVLRDPIPPLGAACGPFAQGTGAEFLARLLEHSASGRHGDIAEALAALAAVSCGTAPPAGPAMADDATAASRPVRQAPSVGHDVSRARIGLIGDSDLVNDDVNMHSIISFHSLTLTRSEPPTIEVGEAAARPQRADDLGFQTGSVEAPRRLGRYELLGPIGQGGMGAVYRAHDQELDRLVAIKMMRRPQDGSDHRWERFRREGTAVARLDHPNIVTIFDVGQLDDMQYLVLELVDGGRLSELLKRGPMPPDDAARLVSTLAKAVDFAHQRGVLHRDLKPANILLTRDGVPKISDFGLAKFVDRPEPLLGMEAPELENETDASSTLSGQVLGTPNYMAPEQTLGHPAEVGRHTDIFTLGILLYEALSGQRPFKGASVLDVLDEVRHTNPVGPHHLRADVPAALGAICAKCLEKRPEDRYPSAAALADDLERFLAGQAPRARRPLALVPAPSPKTWRRFLAWWRK